MQSFQITIYELLGALELLLVLVLAVALLGWRNRRSSRRVQLLEAALRRYRQQPEPPAAQTAAAAEGETVSEPEQAGDGVEGETETEAETGSEQGRTAIDTHEQEFCRLKEVIANQHGAMRALRAELEAQQQASSGVDAAAGLLDEYERQSRELENCVRVLEDENARLKSHRTLSLPGETPPSSGTADLRELVSAQQDTIEGLRSLVTELAPDEAQAQELAAALDAIQHSSGQLAGCVERLEDENRVLRSELEQVREQLEAGAAQAADVDIAVAAAPADDSAGACKKAG